MEFPKKKHVIYKILSNPKHDEIKRDYDKKREYFETIF